LTLDGVFSCMQRGTSLRLSACDAGMSSTRNSHNLTILGRSQSSRHPCSRSTCICCTRSCSLTLSPREHRWYNSLPSIRRRTASSLALDTLSCKPVDMLLTQEQRFCCRKVILRREVNFSKVSYPTRCLSLLLLLLLLVLRSQSREATLALRLLCFLLLQRSERSCLRCHRPSNRCDKL